MEKEHSLAFNLLAELYGTMEEQAVPSVNSIVQSATRTAKALPEVISFMSKLKYCLWLLAGITIVGGSVYLIWRYKLFTGLVAVLFGAGRRVQNRLRARPATVVTSGESVPRIAGEDSAPTGYIGNHVHLGEHVSYRAATEGLEMTDVPLLKELKTDSSGRKTYIGG